MRERELKKVIDKVEEIRVKNINIFLVIYYNIYFKSCVFFFISEVKNTINFNIDWQIDILLIIKK